MLNLHLLECTIKGYDHISDLLLAKYWVITGCKYYNCFLDQDELLSIKEDFDGAQVYHTNAIEILTTKHLRNK